VRAREAHGRTEEAIPVPGRFAPRPRAILQCLFSVILDTAAGGRARPDRACIRSDRLPVASFAAGRHADVLLGNAAWAALAVAGFSFQVSQARRKGTDACG
jgi:hypothetical protein